MRESSWYSCLSEYLGFLFPDPGGWGGGEIRCKELWGPLAVQSNPPTHPPHKKKRERKPLGAQAHP